jgi:hypothetical protein
VSAGVAVGTYVSKRFYFENTHMSTLKICPQLLDPDFSSIVNLGDLTPNFTQGASAVGGWEKLSLNL